MSNALLCVMAALLLVLVIDRDRPRRMIMKSAYWLFWALLMVIAGGVSGAVIGALVAGLFKLAQSAL